MVDDKSTYRLALEDFRKERSRAILQQFWGGLTGKSMDLLPYDEISSRLHATARAELGLQDIPLDAIVGSVGRYEDFNRNFLPLMDTDIDRWARVKTVMTSPSSNGVPPISVYKIGEVYFVLDGNHRVSIAKQMGLDTIEAYVTEIQTKVSITPDVSPEELILKEEYVNFLEDTHLDKILPNIEFLLTFPGQYEILKEHIRVHRYYLGIENKREIGYEEGVKSWFENVYLPIVSKINESGLLNIFKGKTETDLYLWILDHQSKIQEEIGWKISTEQAAADLVNEQGKDVTIGVGRGELHVREVLGWTKMSDLENLHENTLESQPECLFKNILVAINGLESGWDALEQAIRINRCSNSEIRGIHVANIEDSEDTKLEDIQYRFSERLKQVNVSGKLVVVKGEISKILSDRSLLNDLLVLKLLYPPAGSFIDRWSSGFSSIIRNIKRPVLVVRELVTDMNNLLLAYDGSNKSNEALFISAYFTARYGSNLNIITVDNGLTDLNEIVNNCKNYLERLNIKYNYFVNKGDFTVLAIDTIENNQIDLLLMGGYKHSAFLEVVLGSSVDPILRKINIPALICV